LPQLVTELLGCGDDHLRSWTSATRRTSTALRRASRSTRRASCRASDCRRRSAPRRQSGWFAATVHLRFRPSR
jgi:hypothetical protein